MLAALLLLMAAGQVSSPAEFVDIMATYRIGGQAVAGAVAVGLIISELAASAGLVSGGAIRQRRAATLALAVALAWSVLAVQAFARGLALDNCGCFGVHAAQSLRWWVLVEDLEFMALAWWVRSRTAAAIEHATMAGSGGAGSPARGAPHVTPR